MEWEIKSTFTEEEYFTMKLALREYRDKAKEMEGKLTKEGKLHDADRWFTEEKRASNALHKLYKNEKMFR